MICRLENISKKISNHVAISNSNYEFNEGMITIINGESGCGKSILLNIIGLLDSPTGSLDYKNKHITMDLLLLLKKRGKTII